MGVIIEVYFSKALSFSLSPLHRFYPKMKMGPILASLEVKPGYGAYMIDFAISKNTVHSPPGIIFHSWRIYDFWYQHIFHFFFFVPSFPFCLQRLFIAQTDNIETSACIISPQEANFIMNGKGVDRRTNVFMDSGPQLPTNVTAMLKYGTNLLQAVGQFNDCNCFKGHYIVVVAFMSMESSLDSSSLPDYVQSDIAVQDSDCDLIEGPSRVSLNCPIRESNICAAPPRSLWNVRYPVFPILVGYTRIRTPVKGKSCKHLQCFDFSNFVNINSRRPSWRCPHCNQHVCYPDIRVDQNMVQASSCEVLREVGKNIADVIISADGSWKAVLESDDNMNQAHDKIPSGENEGSEQQQPPGFLNPGPNVVDLTKYDDEMDAMILGETEDRKPILTDLQSQPVPINISRPSELSNTVGVNQNAVSQGEDDFWAGILSSLGPASSSVDSISVPASANFMTSSLLADAISPAITDAISHALNRETEALGYSNLTTSMMQSQYLSPNDLQLQQSHFVNHHEYGRLSLNRNINRTPIAIQALPAQSQTPSPQQRSGTNFNFVTPNGSSLASQSALSVGNGYNGSSLASQTALSVGNGYSDMERQQQFSRSPLNAFLGPDIASSSVQHQSAAQVVGLPAPSIYTGAYRASSGLSTENQSLHQQQVPNIRMPQSRSQSPRMIQSPSPLSRTPTQQGSAVQVQTSRKGPTYQANTEGARASAGEQRVNTGGLLQQIRAENSAELPSEQNWQPTGRMRGSLSGRAYSAALSQFMIQPTQPTQVARPLSNPTSQSTALPHLQGSSAPHLQGSSLSTAPPHLRGSSLSTAAPHLQGYLSNSRRAHIPQMQNNPNTEPDLGMN
ncbi:hypothetical protein Patl1_17633 [Pistacia atlantica]|uniref:Uncharacterized protein n=1 Tax=Pistacia atlantica TaxID=434234 RepID=A0ACC1C282_9ROSI|nr:hypothetical protein Patl1_17633 [Pistacia atlantica]